MESLFFCMVTINNLSVMDYLVHPLEWYYVDCLGNCIALILLLDAKIKDI